MATDLDFRGASPPTSARVDLDFGSAGDTPPASAVAILRGVLGGPRLAISAHYRANVSRPLTGVDRIGWQRAALEAAAVATGWGGTEALRAAPRTSWQRAVGGAVALVAPMAHLPPLRFAAAAVWQDGARRAGLVRDHFRDLFALRAAPTARWVIAAPSGARSRSDWSVSLPLPRQAAMRWAEAEAASPLRPFAWQAARWRTEARTLPWQDGHLPPAGVSPRPSDPPPPVIEPRRPPIALDLRCPPRGDWPPSLALSFSARPCPGRAPHVPVLRAYFVSNDISIVRLPGREPVPATRVQLSIDADAWAWDVSASVPYAALPLIEPTVAGPVELEIAINGLTWIVLVEDFDLHREFGASRVTIRGRSRAAWLAEPYAPARSFAATEPATARQLAEQELTRADLATGFALDWQLPDWLVPAGAWSYQGLTPLAAVLRLVGSVGGTLNAHPRELRLAARSRYPVLPWRWGTATPDVTLPLDAVRALDLRWQEKPAFNAVHVAGERHGLVARVLRGGSAGDRVAPMVVDPLITHADAARERGSRILADTGRQARVTLELPMLPSLGLLEPGQLVAVGQGGDAWRGLVRANQVAAQWTDTLTVRQTVELERHYGA